MCRSRWTPATRARPPAEGSQDGERRKEVGRVRGVERKGLEIAGLDANESRRALDLRPGRRQGLEDPPVGLDRIEVQTRDFDPAGDGARDKKERRSAPIPFDPEGDRTILLSSFDGEALIAFIDDPDPERFEDADGQVDVGSALEPRDPYDARLPGRGQGHQEP